MPSDRIRIRRRLRLGLSAGLSLAVLLGLVACGGSKGGSEAVGSITIVSGDGQVGPTGEVLAEPLKVRVIGRSGGVLAGITVRFDVLEGGGAILEPFVRTEIDGTAEAELRLGNRPVRHRVVAAVTGESVEFEARAVAAPVVPDLELSGLILPEHLAFDNNGGMLVGTQLFGSVFRITRRPPPRNDLISDNFSPGGADKTIRGIAFDQAGRLYACEQVAGAIVRIDESGARTPFIEQFEFEPLANPAGIAVHPRTGDIYFSEGGTGRIFYVPQQGRPLQVFATAIPNPGAMAFDASGDFLFVNALGVNGVLAFQVLPDGSAGGLAPVANVPQPSGIALDVDGNIYVSGSEGLSSGIYIIPEDGSGASLLAPAPTGTIYRGIAFGRGTGFDSTRLYIVTLNGTIQSIPLGVEGLPLPAPENDPFKP